MQKSAGQQFVEPELGRRDRKAEQVLRRAGAGSEARLGELELVRIAETKEKTQGVLSEKDVSRAGERISNAREESTKRPRSGRQRWRGGGGVRERERGESHLHQSFCPMSQWLHFSWFRENADPDVN